MNQRSIGMATQLVQTGLMHNLNSHDRYSPLFSDLTSGHFPIAVAIGLYWTGHAVFDEEFIEYASEFINGRRERDAELIARHSWRYGVESLDGVLLNFRNFFRHSRQFIPEDFINSSVEDIQRLQSRLLNQLVRMRNDRQVVGIKTWLLLGPIKIILIHQSRLWGVQGVNDIILSTGSEINQGLERLLRLQYSFMENFDSTIIDETGLLQTDYGNCQIIQRHFINRPEFVGTSALHLNTGLHHYGKGEILDIR